MSGVFLTLVFLLIRFGLLWVLNHDAVQRAAHFAPLEGKARIAIWPYQLATVAVLLYPCFLTVRTAPMGWFVAGVVVYGIGVVLCVLSMVDFARADGDGLHTGGLYRFSRNPIYVAYFFYFTGCALLTQSWLLFGFVVVLQVSTHWIILAEERWCLARFGEPYRAYMQQVRRYL